VTGRRGSSAEPDDGLCFQVEKLRDLPLELSLYGDAAAEEGLFHLPPHLDVFLFEIIPKLVPLLKAGLCMGPDKED